MLAWISTKWNTWTAAENDTKLEDIKQNRETYTLGYRSPKVEKSARESVKSRIGKGKKYGC